MNCGYASAGAEPNNFYETSDVVSIKLPDEIPRASQTTGVIYYRLQFVSLYLNTLTFVHALTSAVIRLGP
jgi:hypothetical protein